MMCWRKWFWFMPFKAIIEECQESDAGRVYIRTVIKCSSPELLKVVTNRLKPSSQEWERAKGTR